VQCIAVAPVEAARAQYGVHDDALVVFGDSGQAEDVPVFLRQNMTDQIVLVQPVHDQHDGTLLLVIEPAVEGVVEPFVGALPVGFGQCLLGLQRVVDDDYIRTPSGQHAADRGGDATALRRRLEFGHRLVPRRQSCREDLPVPVAGDDAPAVARQFVGEFLRIADAEDLGAWIAPQTPRRERDRRQ
jgi:hypothetical protein